MEVGDTASPRAGRGGLPPRAECSVYLCVVRAGLGTAASSRARRSRKGPRAELRRTKTTKANGDQRFQIYTQAGQFVWEGDFVSSQGVASGVNYVNLNGSLIAKLVADWQLPAQRTSDGRTTKLSGVFRNVFADAGATSIVAPADGSTPQRLADVPVTYHLRYVHTDALGSPVVETNVIGEEITGTRTLYEPYGTPLTTPRDGAPSYTGHPYDTGTGLIYAQQRYYDPLLGVFYSPDPMAVDTTSAFNFNRYAYANNSPYRFKDPDGRNGVTAFGGLIAESWNAVNGRGFDGDMVWGALKDGYDGEGDGVVRSAVQDALAFVPVAKAGQAAKYVAGMVAARVAYRSALRVGDAIAKSGKSIKAAIENINKAGLAQKEAVAVVQGVVKNASKEMQVVAGANGTQYAIGTVQAGVAPAVQIAKDGVSTLGTVTVKLLESSKEIVKFVPAG
jgi:RHS repeat-associated protein